MSMPSYLRNKSHKLADEYLHNPASVEHLFERHYLDENAWFERANWLDQHSKERASEIEVSQVLLDYNRKIGNTEKTLNRLGNWTKSHPYVIVGGQQPGLFGGPLFSIYKAITLIRVAQQASEKLQHEVIPVFWIAGEDHDFEEANHFYYQSSSHQIEKCKINRPTLHRKSISKMPILKEEWERVIQHIAYTLSDSVFKPSLLKRMQNIIDKPEMTLTEHFAKWMTQLFGDYGLVFFDSDDPMIRKLETPFFMKLIDENHFISDNLMATYRYLRQHHYRPQVDFDSNYSHLFLTHQNERKLLIQRDNGFSDKKNLFFWSKSELLERVTQNPSDFSNGVMTRPLMQEFIFPVLATVLGSAEVNYWSMLKSTFLMMNMKMPIIVPRLEFTLLDPRVQHAMKKHDISIEDVWNRFDELKKEVTQKDEVEIFNQKFEEISTGLLHAHHSLIDWVNTSQPQLNTLSHLHIKKIKIQLQYFQSKAIQQLKSSQESIDYQLQLIENTIIPLAKPQERVYNIVSYLNRFGDGWIDEFVTTPYTLDSRHRIFHF